MLAQAFADDIEAAGERRVAALPDAGMVAVSAFSGLVSSPWALASAPAMSPMASLDRCIGHLEKVKTDRP